MNLQSSEPIRDFIEKNQRSISWMAKHLAVTERTIYRIKTVPGYRVYQDVWDRFLEFSGGVESEIPLLGSSGFWGVRRAAVLGRWTGFFNFNGTQHTITSSKTKAIAIHRARALAKDMGVQVKIGAYQHKSLKKPWCATVTAKRNNRWRNKHLGYFATPEEAARAHDREARKLGQKKRLNFL